MALRLGDRQRIPPTPRARLPTRNSDPGNNSTGSGNPPLPTPLSLNRDSLVNQCEQFAQLVILYGLTVERACHETGLALSSARRIMSSATYVRMEEELFAALDIQKGRPAQEQLETDLVRMTPLALMRHKGILAESKNEGVVMRAIEANYDRAGLPRATKQEHHGTINHGLDEGSLRLMAEVFREMQAAPNVVDLPRTDWGYAFERPADGGVADAERGSPRALADGSEAVDLLHGEGRLRIRGPGSGPPRDDGGVDSEADPPEAGFSPESSS